jgi:BolA protein
MSTAAPTTTNLQARLQERLAPTRLEVLDESHQHAGHAGANGTGFGTHFRVRIASHLFTDKSRVARHRLVYDALQDFIDQGLHALAIEAEDSPSGNTPT